MQKIASISTLFNNCCKNGNNCIFQPKKTSLLSSLSTNKFSTFIPDLITSAKESSLRYQLAACIVKGKKKITTNQCNAPGEGYGGSRHAELRAILSLYGSKNIKLTSNGWKISDEIKRKNRNLGILVIRIATIVSKEQKNNNIILVNARPCQKCRDMMKSLGFREVHYSNDTGEIITEKIDHMVSVHASFVAVKFEYITNKSKETNSEAIKDVDLHNIINREEYYDNIIKQKIPDKVREINFTHFISYDFKNIPVDYKLIHKDNFVTILNGQNKVVKVVNIV